MLNLSKLITLLLITIIYALLCYVISDEKLSLLVLLAFLLGVSYFADTVYEPTYNDVSILKIDSWIIIIFYVLSKGLVMYFLTSSTSNLQAGSLFFVIFSTSFGIGFGLVSQIMLAYLVNVVLSLNKNFAFFYRNIIFSHVVPICACITVTILNYLFLKGEVQDEINESLMRFNRLIFSYSDLLMILLLHNLYAKEGIEERKALSLAVMPYLLLGLPTILTRLL